MQICEDTTNATYSIVSYTSNSVMINHQVYTRSLIVAPHHLILDWPLFSINELSLSTLQSLLDLNPEIILLGTGQTFKMPNPALWLNALPSKIGIEYMSTSSAIRTYAALSAEGRNVVAGLIFEINES